MNRTEESGAIRAWDRIVGTYTVGQEVIRPVGKVVPALGVFVKLEPGFDALIHISKIIGLGDQDPRRFYTSGQEVEAKIINIDQVAQRVELAATLIEFSFDKFLSSEDQIVARDIGLDDLEVTGAVLDGTWMNNRTAANVQLVKRSENELSLQLQTKSDYLKSVHITLRQDGPNVVAHVDWCAYISPNCNFGYDLSSDREGAAPIATNPTAEGYGVAELHFRKKPKKVAENSNIAKSLAEAPKAKIVLVDGSNIVRRWPNLRSEALALLLEGLKANGFIPTVLFDANILHVLLDSGDSFGQCLVNCMTRETPEHAIIVPAGSRSDDFILLLADRRGYDIVSCDTFRDDIFAKYSWLQNRMESGEKRVHAPAFILGDLVIPSLGLVWPVAHLGFDKFLLKQDVVVRACCNGEFFCAEEERVKGHGRRIMANRDNPSDWEKFVFIRNADGSVCVKSKINSKFVSACLDDGGILQATDSEVRDSDKFWVSKCDASGYYALRSCLNMKYVSIDPNNGSVAANVDIPNDSVWLNISACN